MGVFYLVVPIIMFIFVVSNIKKKKMAKKKKQTPEELEHNNMLRNVEEEKRAILLNITPKNPTRFFDVGERVTLGAHEEVYVREVHADGMFYVTEAIGVKRNRDKQPRDEMHVNAWQDLYKYDQNQPTQFTKEEKYYIRQLNSPIDSLLSMVYAPHAGVDFDVDYQRDHVWELEDKVALIDSIYNNIDIGKIVFVQLNEKTEGRYYQVLDGKQRLTALCEFFEDRFPYKGVYFSQLSHQDKHTFKNHGITYGYLENPTKRGIYESFVKLNTCGRPMDNKHIDKVRKLLNDLEDDV